MEKIIYLVLLVLIIVVICIEPRFLSILNFRNILAQSSTRIIIALAAGMLLTEKIIVIYTLKNIFLLNPTC